MKIFRQQSHNPLNSLSLAALPISTPNLVLLKSNGYTHNSPILPAIPPLRRVPKKYLKGLSLALIPATNFLFKASFTEKFIA